MVGECCACPLRGGGESAQKFAELIVKSCAQLSFPRARARPSRPEERFGARARTIVTRAQKFRHFLRQVPATLSQIPRHSFDRRLKLAGNHRAGSRCADQNRNGADI